MMSQTTVERFPNHRVHLRYRVYREIIFQRLLSLTPKYSHKRKVIKQIEREVEEVNYHGWELLREQHGCRRFEQSLRKNKSRE